MNADTPAPSEPVAGLGDEVVRRGEHLIERAGISNPVDRLPNNTAEPAGEAR